jgi:hypothetical protein
MNTRSIQRNHGYLLVECLAYIGVLFVLLGVSYLALFRCINNSVALRRNAEDLQSPSYRRMLADRYSFGERKHSVPGNQLRAASLPSEPARPNRLLFRQQQYFALSQRRTLESTADKCRVIENGP